MDAVREIHDPDVIWRTAEDWPEPGPYVGREAVMGLLDRVREAWDADWIEQVGGFAHAAHRVVVRSIWHGVGRGPESKMEWTTVFTVRKGKIHSQEFFWDHDEALETVGLSD
jgi:ketosteroid isomerase-like protein